MVRGEGGVPPAVPAPPPAGFSDKSSGLRCSGVAAPAPRLGSSGLRRRMAASRSIAMAAGGGGGGGRGGEGVMDGVGGEPLSGRAAAAAAANPAAAIDCSKRLE